MATKINQSVYGTVPTTTYSRAVCPNNIGTLYSAGNYDPTGDCEDGFEKSISPWGIGGGMSLDVFVGNAQRSANGRFAKLNIDVPENYNKPVSFWDIGITEGSQDNNKPQRYRIGGNLKYNTGNFFVSNGYTENGLFLWGANATTKPIGKIEYNHILLYPSNICIRGNENYSNPLNQVTYNISTIEDNPSIVTDDIELTAFSWGCKMYNSSSSTPNQWEGADLALVNAKSQEVPEIYKAMSMRDYSDNSIWYDKAILSLPHIVGAFDEVGRLIPSRSCSTGNSYCKLASADFTSSSQLDYTRYGFGKCYGVGNTNKHVFNDISYHYEVRCFYELNGVYREVLEGELMLEQTMYFLPYFKIDETTYNTKWESMKAIIRHELAFIGFPFVMANNQTGNIGDSNVSVPIFDSHMITTGRYITGSAASQLPNSQWGDIFSDTMPEYDPNYNPPKPTPSSDDFGDLYNSGSFNKFPSCLTAYAMSLEKFQSVIQSINTMYQTDPDGVKQWELDFKGSNPSDYIVGAYVSVCNFGLSESTYPITIGPVDLSVAVPTMVANKILFTDSGYFDCGSVDIDHFYSDFRDYAPYTQLELYLPLCGTVELDTAYFMGHSVSITYYYDYNTMSCSACIYRDGITLYKVVNGSIGAEIPLTSMRMGDYQNAIHALEQAQKQNEIRMASAMVSMGISAAGLLAAPVTGGASLGLTALGLNGVKSGIETVNAIDDISYNIEHKQPTPAQTGASEAQNSFCVGSMYPYLFIKRAKMLEDFDGEIYGHTVGYACNVNAHIGDMSGYTVATNIDTSGINATVEEINAIKQAFSKGVYL